MNDKAIMNDDTNKQQLHPVALKLRNAIQKIEKKPKPKVYIHQHLKQI